MYVAHVCKLVNYIRTITYLFCRLCIPAHQVLRRAGFCRAQNCSSGLQPHQDSQDFEVFHGVTGSLAQKGLGDLAPNVCWKKNSVRVSALSH